jgi:hypothetical protein
LVRLRLGNGLTLRLRFWLASVIVTVWDWFSDSGLACRFSIRVWIWVRDIGLGLRLVMIENFGLESGLALGF